MNLSRWIAAALMVLAVAGCAGSGKTGQRVDYSSQRHEHVIATSDPDKAPTGDCPPGMIYIPNGPTLYGPTEEKNVKPAPKEVPQRVNMKAYCIDKFEYPNEPGEAPTRSLSWLEAKDMCGNRGKRLCSEYEFEKACRGPSGNTYTYGDGFADKICPAAGDNYGLGQYTGCVSGFDVHDMGGGVFEWTSTTVGDDPKADLRILRGGMNAENAEANSKCTYRSRYGAKQSSKDVGFRCCASSLKEPPPDKAPEKK